MIVNVLPQSATAGERLSGTDMAWLRMEEPNNLMTITGILALAAPLSASELRALLAERLLPVKRFRQRIVRHAGQVHWLDEPDIDLDIHVQTLQLAEPDSKTVLEEKVGEVMSQPLDYSRPLWSFHLIENFRGGGVLVSRVHHSIGDGIALMMVLLSLTELSATGGDQEDRANPLAALFRQGGEINEAVLERARQLLPEGMKLMIRPASGAVPKSKAVLAARATATLAKMTFRSADPKTLFKGALGLQKLVAWSAPIPLADVRALKEAMNATINDVLLTAMTGGLRRYLEGRGQQTAGLDFRAAVPVSLRPVDKLSALGNQFGLVFLALPVGIADPDACLAELKRRMQALKGSLEAGVVLGVLYGMGLSPMLIQRLIVKIFGSKTTAVMTNVPGPRQPLYLAGRQIDDILFWVPQSGRVALGISIISYNGKVRLGVTTDAGLVPDPAVIVDGFHRELAEMQRRAGLSS